MATASAMGRDTVLQANTDARRLLKQALTMDEDGKTSQSVQLYQECCRVLLAGMSVDVMSVARDETDVKHLQSLQTKMSQLFDNASTRLQNMECVVPTPQYSAEASDNSMQSSLLKRTEADMVFVLTRGVRMLMTASTGEVSEQPGPVSLKVFLIPTTGNQGTATGAPAFLQCDSWVYPLIPGCSPIFKSSPRSYTFPDVNERANPFGMSSEGSLRGMQFVTIVLTDEVNDAVVAQLGQTLATLSNVQDQSGVSAMANQGTATTAPAPAATRAAPPVPPPTYSDRSSTAAVAPSGLDAPNSTVTTVAIPGSNAVESETPTWATKISSGIAVGANVASSVLSGTAQLLGKAVQAGSVELKQHIGASETVEMSETTKTAVKGAKMASKAVVVVSEQVVTTVSSIAKVLSDQFVPIAMEKISMSGDGTPRDPVTQARLKGAAHVGSAGLDGIVQVYKSLESAAKHVGRGIHKATVDTVKYRYGDSAASVTDDSVSAVANVVQASHNFDNVGLKALAKRTAVHAGRRGMESLNGQDSQTALLDEQQQQPGESHSRAITYPDVGSDLGSRAATGTSSLPSSSSASMPASKKR
eukprot:scpid31301/ scgid1331/ Spartin